LRWLEVSFTVDAEQAEVLSELLARHSLGGVALLVEADEDGAATQRPVRLSAYLPEDGELDKRRLAIEKGLWHLSQIRPFPRPSYNWHKHENWTEAWKKHYRPMPVGKRLLIYPPWLKPPTGSRIPLIIEPGMSFGTGIHPSTRLCLQCLEKYLRPDCLAADLGCGSGILSIAAARLGASRVLALDIDALAVQATRENIRRNAVTQQVLVRQGSLAELLAWEKEIHRQPDLLVVNILAKVLLEMLEAGLPSAIGADSLLILSGILEEQAPSLQTQAERLGLQLVASMAEQDWRALVLKRVSPPGMGGETGDE
jgi:ribosomal protein L11 methyltransferase